MTYRAPMQGESLRNFLQYGAELRLSTDKIDQQSHNLSINPVMLP